MNSSSLFSPQQQPPRECWPAGRLQLQQFKIHFWISFVLTAAAAETTAAASSIFI